MSLRTQTRIHRLMERLKQETADDPSDFAEPEVALDTSARNIALRNALQTLSADRRRLVALRWYDGLTVPQIAYILETTVGAVEQKLLRTLRALRQVIDTAR